MQSASSEGYSLHEAVMGDTFKALEEAQILTLLSMGWAGEDPFAFSTSCWIAIRGCR